LSAIAHRDLQKGVWRFPDPLLDRLGQSIGSLGLPCRKERTHHRGLILDDNARPYVIGSRPDQRAW
jgi:hypothetical protein